MKFYLLPKAPELEGCFNAKLSETFSKAIPTSIIYKKGKYKGNYKDIVFCISSNVHTATLTFNNGFYIYIEPLLSYQKQLKAIFKKDSYKTLIKKINDLLEEKNNIPSKLHYIKNQPVEGGKKIASYCLFNSVVHVFISEDNLEIIIQEFKRK